MSVAEDAREEARARWSEGPQHGMSPQLHAGLLYGFIAGAVWQSERPATDAEVAAAQRAVRENFHAPDDGPPTWWIKSVIAGRAVLDAARKARMQ